jgi:cystathionine beta-lyase
MDFKSLEKVGPGGTFFLCNPHNPVGTCFSEADLRRLLELCRKKDWVLCSDEIHCDLILDDNVHHVPTLTLADSTTDQVAALYAPSKTYNLPGLACAFAVIPNAKLRAQFKREILGIITEINCFGYAGCAAAYNEGEPWRQELLTVLRANRDLLYRFFAAKNQHIAIYPMEATYLAWLDCRKLPVDNPAKFFEDHGVGLSDGKPFGAAGWLRLNFGCPTELLEKGLERIQKALSGLEAENQTR